MTENKKKCNDILKLYTDSIYPKCPKKSLCSRGDCGFSEKPKMPYIGSEYGNHRNIPNLLFISLDSGTEYTNLHSIEEIRKEVEEHPPTTTSGRDKGKHWYQTFDLANLILSQYLNESQKKYIHKYVAHTNSAKCTQNKKNNKQADGHIFENCRDFFVIKEIPLFHAQIIITQGKYAEKCLHDYQTLQTEVLKTTHKNKSIEFPIYIREQNNHKILHIPMYHPSYYKGYWGQKQALQDNIKFLKPALEKLFQNTQ